MKSIFKKLDRKIRALEMAVVSLSIISMTIIIFLNVVLRYVFKNSWTWAEELGRYIMIWLSLIGASLCVRDNVHVTMDILMNVLPEKMKKTLLFIIYTGSAFVSLYLGYLGWKFMYRVKVAKQFSTVMEFLPMWCVYLAIPISGILMAKNFIHLIILNMKSNELVETIEGGE